ncbi:MULTISPECIES: ABC transporter permease [Rhizobium/Agrobacterium group]|uniref:ABC transporter permease n=1 Tax=Rhizobium/Agrobacterium group TaxID=227290 RepID=UPI000B4063F5|nr:MULTISPECIES: ABC transporter permease [Rhizobium/Agrobacterium group]MCF1483985.1 ABC transporter permease [Allorhizobium ampelinum]NSZ45846.1 ABC transporter permease [Agrobacterium vitis]NTA29562.1 ABC transporter permease [Allorhizobium ampelinum]OVE88545.1 ABC transporter permease [Allorhizobium ampelinum]
MIDFGFFFEIIPKLLSGLPLTLTLAGTSIVCGFVLALVLALVQQGERRWVVWPVRAFVAVFRGTPLLVQIFLIYYGLGQFRPSLQAAGLWWLFREPYWCAILALTLNTAAYGSEILRGAIRNVPRGLIEAASALGMSRLANLRFIILPLALRQAIPAYGNEIILMVKGTSLASIITLMEVTGIAQGLISQSYRAIEVFMAAGAIYLLLNFIIVRALTTLEARLTLYRTRS